VQCSKANSEFGNVVNAGEQCGWRRKTEGRCVFRDSAHCVGSRASFTLKAVSFGKMMRLPCCLLGLPAVAASLLFQ
jgi:hypothetical protein